MINPFICGIGSFQQQIEEEDESCLSPCSTPRKQRKSSLCRSKDSKNPYANRGLDKFSALLAELEDKRKRIYNEIGSDEISLVRFEYSNSNDCKPIVVKIRDHKHQEDVNIGKDKPVTHNNSEDLENHPTESSNEVQRPRNELGDSKITKKSYSWNFLKMGTWKRPSFYLPVAIILILLFLAVFGRSFAILCTSIGWYLVPMMNGGGSNVKRPKKKKEYVRRASEKKIIRGGLSSPTSVITGAMNDVSPRRHGHQKSW